MRQADLLLLPRFMIRLETPRFVAGIEVRDGKLFNTAPVVRYMKRNRWTPLRVVAHARRMGWRVDVWPLPVESEP